MLGSSLSGDAAHWRHAGMHSPGTESSIPFLQNTTHSSTRRRYEIQTARSSHFIFPESKTNPLALNLMYILFDIFLFILRSRPAASNACPPPATCDNIVSRPKPPKKTETNGGKKRPNFSKLSSILDLGPGSFFFPRGAAMNPPLPSACKSPVFNQSKRQKEEGEQS